MHAAGGGPCRPYPKRPRRRVNIYAAIISRGRQNSAAPVTLTYAFRSTAPSYNSFTKTTRRHSHRAITPGCRRDRRGASCAPPRKTCQAMSTGTAEPISSWPWTGPILPRPGQLQRSCAGDRPERRDSRPVCRPTQLEHEVAVHQMGNIREDDGEVRGAVTVDIAFNLMIGHVIA